MFEIELYTPDRVKEWNHFVCHSKNGTFLFDRRYMDYHRDRFSDVSLMIYHNGRLMGLLPLHQTTGGTAISHGGLTYGGLVLDQRATAVKVCEMFRAINVFLRSRNFKQVVYKPIPRIYHSLPAEEDLYALFHVCRGQIVRRELTSVIAQSSKINFTESRKSGRRKAEASGIRVREATDYPAFWNILCQNLEHRYHAAPVHTLSEIQQIAATFPDRVKLFLAYQGEIPLGGTVLYITPQVVHTQYISASPEGKRQGALDLLFQQLINEIYPSVPYFDFGTSTADERNGFNASLLFQKEGFGGRSVCCDTYEWKL